MSKIIKVIDNETIEISCYVNPRICFENEGYDDYDSYCIYKEIINPFKMFEENKRLNYIINELEKYHIKSMENLKNTEDFKYVGVNHIKILYEEHKRTLERIKELKEDKKNKKINYSIEKHEHSSNLKGKLIYVLWKESDYSCYGIYQGSKQECEKYLKKIKK